ncbi:MAG: alcohol dehydrogenase catalytic domain-containing protein [Micrococcales bacterium]|nr:alcohol dehydrogenase catalytic domain-containing protein [Micrococcales bacterium]
MKALVYHGPGQKAWEEIADPHVKEPTDAVVQVDTTTICGSDLHILKGDVPEVVDGLVLGHEAVGTIVELGTAVRNHKIGDRVVVSCMTFEGTCEYCRKGLTSKCQAVGGDSWQLGHWINGTQAEYVHTPLADLSLFKLPEGVSDAAAVMTSDIMSTGYEIGVVNGKVFPASSVVVIGAGPVGLCAMLTASLHGPAKVVAVDMDPNRLEVAQASFGATHGVNSADPDWKDQVKGIVGKDGADVVIEAVGIPVTLEAAWDLIKPGGYVANVGVHGKPVNLPIERLWTSNIVITTGLVNMVTGPMMLDLLAANKLNVDALATHNFKLDQFVDAYEVFGAAAKNQALKMILTR